MTTIQKQKRLFVATAISLAVSGAVHAQSSHGVLLSDETEQTVMSSPLPVRYIVKFKENQSVALMDQHQQLNSYMAANKLQGLGIKNAVYKAHMHSAITPLTKAQLASLRLDPAIEFVEQDLPRRLMAQQQPYGIAMVQADLVDDSVASAAMGGKKICVIDSGLDLPHEDMGTNGVTITGTNNSGTGNWHDQGGPHGTHVAGTIAALNNGLGVRGVIGSNPNLHIIKVFNASGWGYSSDLVSAINECQNAGSDVVNMSLGGTGSSNSERNGIQAAADAGMLLIAAAGNDGVPSNTTDIESYPASYDSVVSVAALDSTKALADFSQKNAQVEIAAPGVDVYSTYPEGTGSVVELSVDGSGYAANGMENQGSITGSLYNFATGEATDGGASGKVCLIQRGNISFHDKVKNCQDSGGIGAVIYNNVAGSFGGTLGTSNSTSIPAVTVSDSDGAAMLNQLGLSTSINIGTGNYGNMSGTSMASPHVAGVAALVWSHHPSCSADEIRTALNASAEDLGDAGRDVKFGYGLVQTKAAIDYLDANGCGGTTPPPPPPTGNELENGVAKTNLAGSTGEELTFTMVVPDGATDVQFAMQGGTGDADLYVRYGAAPTTSTYDCRPYRSGNSESCAMTQGAGTYHVMVRAYSSFSGVSLTGSYTDSNGGGNGGVDAINDTISNISVARRSWQRYTLDLTEGYQDLNIEMSGGSGDADLYINYGQQSSRSSYDCRPYKNGNNETCSFSAPQAGTWHIDVYGYSAASGVTLNITATPQ